MQGNKKQCHSSANQVEDSAPWSTLDREDGVFTPSCSLVVAALLRGVAVQFSSRARRVD